MAAPTSEGELQGPELPSVEDDPLPDVAPSGPAPIDTATEATEPEPDTPEQSVEPPAPSLQEPETIHVAVGLSSELDGAKRDRELLDTLERAVKASPTPKADVRRLRVGAAEPNEICREGADDLVITIGYAPDQTEPVLMTYDCRLRAELGTRRSIAASDPDLLGVLWGEHLDRVANGERERKRVRVSPKVRIGLISGAAVIVIGVAVGLLVAAAVQRDTVVLVVSP